MLDYQDYKDSGGTLSQVEFNELEPKIVALIYNYISENIPYWKTKDSIEEYELDLTKILTEQIDFIAFNGGLNALSGRSDFSVRNIKTSVFSYDVAAGRIDFFHNIPMSPIALPMLINQMRRKGLLYKGL